MVICLLINVIKIYSDFEIESLITSDRFKNMTTFTPFIYSIRSNYVLDLFFLIALYNI